MTTNTNSARLFEVSSFDAEGRLLQDLYIGRDEDTARLVEARALRSIQEGRAYPAVRVETLAR